MKSSASRLLGFLTLIMVGAGSGAASAQYYGGLNFDSARYSQAALAAPEAGFFLANTALDDHRVRYGLKLGYQLSPRFALVSRYSMFDRRELFTPLVRSYGLDVESHVPLLAGLAVSGSAGIARLGSGAASGTGFYSGLLSNPVSRAYTAGHLGLGMQYQFNGSLGLRFDVERYRALSGANIGDLGADHLSLGVMVRF